MTGDEAMGYVVLIACTFGPVLVFLTWRTDHLKAEIEKLKQERSPR